MSAALTVHAAKVNIYNHNSTNHHKNSHNVTDTTTIASNNDHSARHRERISITDSSCVRWDKGLGHDDLLASQSHSYLDLFNPDTHTHHVAASMQPVDNHLAPPLKPYEQSASSHSPATPTPSTISTGGRTWKSKDRFRHQALHPYLNLDVTGATTKLHSTGPPGRQGWNVSLDKERIENDSEIYTKPENDIPTCLMCGCPSRHLDHTSGGYFCSVHPASGPFHIPTMQSYVTPPFYTPSSAPHMPHRHSHYQCPIPTHIHHVHTTSFYPYLPPPTSLSHLYPSPAPCANPSDSHPPDAYYGPNFEFGQYHT